MDQSSSSTSSFDDAAESLDYLEEFDPSRGIAFWQHLVAGSVAGLAEHCVMFPLDTIKTQAQCVGACSEAPSTDVLCVRAAKSLLREGYENGIGALRLWRGVGAVTASCVPAHALYFGTFEAVRGWKQQDDVIVNGLAGSMAAVGHDIVMTPADVVKQRLQLGLHTTLSGCLTAMQRSPEGLWPALYRSLPTTLAMNAPYNSVSVAANEYFKGKWRDSRRPDAPLPVHTLLLSGGLAGAIASFATTPLDVIKTRLQTQGLVRHAPRRRRPCADRARGAAEAKGICPPTGLRAEHLTTDAQAGVRYRGFVDAAHHIWRSEGIRGFFRGGSMRALAQAPSVAIVWTTYEFLIGVFRENSANSPTSF